MYIQKYACVLCTELVGSLETRVVRQAACGLEHSVVLTDAGQVFTWGSNQRGQLGRGHLDAQATKVPRLVSHSGSTMVMLSVSYTAHSGGTMVMLSVSYILKYIPLW